MSAPRTPPGLQNLLRDKTANAADLSQYSKTSRHSSGDVYLHWCIRVDGDAQMVYPPMGSRPTQVREMSTLPTVLHGVQHTAYMFNPQA